MNHQHTLPLGHSDSWAERIRRSKALIPMLAVLGVTTLALAASLVAHRSDAHLAAAGIQPSQQQQVVTAPPAAAGSPRPAPYVAAPRAAVARCGNCGTVESVATVQRSAPTSGVGAVAGGVVGGLLGNQVGGGNGRTAMTVLGAVGGGYAGNAIEKNMKKHTVYRIHVRMNDGSLRTVEQGTAVAAGARVVLENGTLRPAPQAAT